AGPQGDDFVAARHKLLDRLGVEFELAHVRESSSSPVPGLAAASPGAAGLLFLFRSNGGRPVRPFIARDSAIEPQLDVFLFVCPQLGLLDGPRPGEARRRRSEALGSLWNARRAGLGVAILADWLRRP